MRLILTISLLVALAACSRKQYPQYLVTEVKDTTILRTEFRDSLVRIPAKQTSIVWVTPWDCPDIDTTVKKGATTVSVTKKGNEMKVTCKEDSLNLVIAGLNKDIFHLRSIKIEVPKPVYTDVPYIPKWVWYTMGILAGLVIVTNLKSIIKFAKIILAFG